MSVVQIDGYGDNLTVNGVRIGDLTPDEHESIEKNKGGQNYSPLENIVVSKVKDSSTLLARRPHPDDIKKYIETELIDGLCCYSAVNQGQLNKTIVDSVIKHLDGICHVYIDDEADLKKAENIAFNAKTYRYGICGAMETLLAVSYTHLTLPTKRIV